LIDVWAKVVKGPILISRTLDRAEAEGLVARGSDPDDRRASQVTLTEAGPQVVTAFAPRLQAIVDRVIHQQTLG